jgi:dihydroflavonol-4-reductase
MQEISSRAPKGRDSDSLATANTGVDLIIGATGFAGGALARELRRRNRPVRALVRPQSRSQPLRELGVTLVEGDVTNAADVLRACRGARIVYNFASPFRSARPTDDYFHAVNVDGVRNIVDAVREAGVERFVHCSTIGVYGDVREIPCRETSPYNPGDIYQRTKLEADLLLQREIDAGLPAVVMRPCSMYGPGDTRMLKMFRLIRSGRWRTVGDGSAWFHACYIDDLVAGFMLCGEHPAALGEVLILAGPEPVRLHDLVAEVARALNVRVPHGRLPLGPMLYAARLCERIFRPFGIEPPLHERRVRFFTNNRNFDGSKARRLLGFVPAVPLADGLARTAVWYREQGLLEGIAPA